MIKKSKKYKVVLTESGVSIDVEGTKVELVNGAILTIYNNNRLMGMWPPGKWQFVSEYASEEE